MRRELQCLQCPIFNRRGSAKRIALFAGRVTPSLQTSFRLRRRSVTFALFAQGPFIAQQGQIVFFLLCAQSSSPFCRGLFASDRRGTAMSRRRARRVSRCFPLFRLADLRRLVLGEDASFSLYSSRSCAFLSFD